MWRFSTFSLTTWTKQAAVKILIVAQWLSEAPLSSSSPCRDSSSLVGFVRKTQEYINNESTKHPLQLHAETFTSQERALFNCTREFTTATLYNFLPPIIAVLVCVSLRQLGFCYGFLNKMFLLFHTKKSKLTFIQLPALSICQRREHFFLWAI